MARYHFNPETGDSGYCRAKPGNCPFLALGSRHYETKALSQAAYEESQENGFLSLTARLMVTRARLQREIIEIFTNPLRKGEERELLNSLVQERNVIETAIKESKQEYALKSNHSSVGPQRIIHEEVADDRGSEIIGIPNAEEDFSAKAPKTSKALVAASEQWLRRLSTAEAAAVWSYAGSPQTANGKGELLSQAIAKAPLLEPTKVYSGLSVHVAKDVLRQLDSGQITLDYPISTSLNPAQVNGFMGKFEGHVQQKAVALEIETTVGGSMAAASHAIHEFEILLPAGTYEVLEQRENVDFLWKAGGAGRTAELLIRLRKIG